MHQESLRATLSMVLCRRGVLEESFTGFLDEFLFLLKKSAKKKLMLQNDLAFFLPGTTEGMCFKTVSFWKVFGEIFSAGDCGGVEVGSIFFYIDLKKEKLTGSNCLKGLQPDKCFQMFKFRFQLSKNCPYDFFWGFWLDKMEKRWSHKGVDSDKLLIEEIRPSSWWYYVYLVDIFWFFFPSQHLAVPVSYC